MGEKVLLEGIGCRQNLWCRAVVLHHHNGAHLGEVFIEVQQVFHIGAPPGVDGLVRVAHDEQVLMIAAKHLHQLILQRVDVLKLVYHDVLQALLPLEFDALVLLKDVEGELDEVVVVQAEALLLLVEVAVKDDVLRLYGVQVLLPQGVQRHGEHVQVVVRVFEQLAYLNHVPGVPVGHLPQGQAALLIDDLEHGVNVGVVQHQEALGVLHGVAVLLEDGHAEAVEGVDVAGVVVPGEGVNPLAHLVGGLVGEGDAQDVPRQDAQLVHQEGKSVGQRPGLPRAGPGDDPDEALSGSDSLPLGRIQVLKDVGHPSSPLFLCFLHYSRPGKESLLSSC